MSKTELRKFGFIFAAMLLVLFELIMPFIWGINYSFWPRVAAVTIFVLALICPKILQLIYTPWMKLGGILGWINTKIILALLYYGVVFPMALVFKLLNYDPLARKIDKHCKSYKQYSKPSNNMEAPF